VSAGELLARIERYYDTAPRAAADVEEHGPFTLFVGTGAWPYYARPRLGLEAPVTAEDVRRVMARQRVLGAPEAIEWVHDVTPQVTEAVEAAGVPFFRHPLMVLGEPLQPQAVPGVTVRTLGPDDPALAATQRAVGLGFAGGGFVAPPTERSLEFTRDMLRRGLTVMVTAEEGGTPVAGGTGVPRDHVTELAGIATVPGARRRGIGAAVTAALVAAAVEAGSTTIFLSAGDDDVARVYARAGFRPVATACVSGG
jgi:GNAT superfamily N-acetyltransferase